MSSASSLWSMRTQPICHLSICWCFLEKLPHHLSRVYLPIRISIISWLLSGMTSFEWNCLWFISKDAFGAARRGAKHIKDQGCETWIPNILMCVCRSCEAWIHWHIMSMSLSMFIKGTYTLQLNEFMWGNKCAILCHIEQAESHENSWQRHQVW